ncbi:MAG: hypothetical protein HYU86_00245 [Chloroflexi bacterium]|nr:hypothetical protein [Chloroflexota bacterium]
MKGNLVLKAAILTLPLLLAWSLIFFPAVATLAWIEGGHVYPEQVAIHNLYPGFHHHGGNDGADSTVPSPSNEVTLVRYMDAGMVLGFSGGGVALPERQALTFQYNSIFSVPEDGVFPQETLFPPPLKPPPLASS